MANYKKKFTVQQVIDAIIANKGLVYNTADSLECDSQTIYNYAKKHPEVQEAIDTARHKVLDVTESRLFEAVDRCEPWAVTFTLKTIGRVRGYVEKQEIKQELSGPNGTPLQIDIDDVTHLTAQERSERLAALLSQVESRAVSKQE